MSTKSKNMNYYFNVEYFDGINLNEKSNEETEKKIADNNKNIINFSFDAVSPLDALKKIEGYQEFELFTVYPGLLLGTGYPHEIAVKGAIKQGFSFDYVTGLPYVPGSSLKGMLRSYFPGDTKDTEKEKGFIDLVQGILSNKNLDVNQFKTHIYENNDIFLGAFPVVEKNGQLLEMEYITPHKEKFKNPIPINIVKIRPGVKFKFAFILSDYFDENGQVLISISEKLELFKELIILMGIGAKTNTGFGRFSKEKPFDNNHVKQETEHRCETCNAPVGMNPKTNTAYRYCQNCTKKWKENNKNAQRV